MALLALAVCPRLASAQTFYTVDPGDVAFRQVDLVFVGVPALSDSQYGWFSAKGAQLLQNSTGGALSLGFLNVSTSRGWIVRNLPIAATSGYAAIGTYFDLGPGPGNVTSLRAQLVLSDQPLVSHGPVAPTDPLFAVGALGYNAQGASGPGGPLDPPRLANPGANVLIDLSGLAFALLGFSVHWQPGHPDVQQASKQCYPASVANSLKYIESQYGIITTNHSNTPGERDNSLVGQLDIAMNRPAGMATPTAYDMVHGKLEYLDDNNREHAVTTQHKQAPGITWLNGTIQSDDGNATSTEDTSATPLIDWIVQQVNMGCDVEVRIGWDGGGGHAFQLTGAGKILGEPFITYAHDAAQGDNATGTTPETGGHGFSFVGDDLGMTCFIDGESSHATISFAVSECPKFDASVPSLPPAWGIVLVLAALAAGMYLLRGRVVRAA